MNCQRQVGPEMDESEDDDEAGRELSVLSIFDKRELALRRASLNFAERNV